MTNYSMSIVGVECPYCGSKMPIPAYMGEYVWERENSYESKRVWFCCNCGEAHTVRVKRHIHDAEVERVVDDN